LRRDGSACLAILLVIVGVALVLVPGLPRGGNDAV